MDAQWCDNAQGDWTVASQWAMIWYVNYISVELLKTKELISEKIVCFFTWIGK